MELCTAFYTMHSEAQVFRGVICKLCASDHFKNNRETNIMVTDMPLHAILKVLSKNFHVNTEASK